MFHFSLDLKDTLNIKKSTLNKFKVREDSEFKCRTIALFEKTHPDVFTEDTDAFYAREDMESEIFFTVESMTPESVDVAVKFVREFSFFPPLRIWINGVEYNTVDYISENIIRIPM